MHLHEMSETSSMDYLNIQQNVVIAVYTTDNIDHLIAVRSGNPAKICFVIEELLMNKLIFFQKFKFRSLVLTAELMSWESELF